MSLKEKAGVPSDLEIAQAAKLKPIIEIAERFGIREDELELYGKHKAKVELTILDRLKGKPNGKYIDVTAITPTPLGEGKTVTTIGLSLGLNKIGKKTFTCIRQPSLGPVFGIKGGAAGGGYSQVVPMEDFNLHLTGDTHAVSLTHNLLAAFLDNSLFHGNPLNIDINQIMLRRVVDVSDRALRNVTIGQGTKDDGIVRSSGFDIAVASEIMAILALATDIADLRKRLGRIIVAFTKDGKPITAEDLKVAGSMAVLMLDAIKPNLMQTLEGTPCFVHAGPFANIAHGNNSIIADKIALKLGDYVVTESGFGADCGAEKFFDIKCRYSGLVPSCAVVVSTIRALKMHGSDKYKVVAGKPLDPALLREDLESVEKGCENLKKQIENVRIFGVPVVVAINEFTTDTKNEIELIKKLAKQAGAEDAVISRAWKQGGRGCTDLANAVVEASQKKNDFKFLYPLEASIEDKMRAIATKIYGADGIDITPQAKEKIELAKRLGLDKLPICMAKTHLSLSHDPKLKGAPKGFVVPIKDLRFSVGAGFLYALLGEMRTMPGLPSVPAGTKIDIDEKGNVVGLS